MYFLSETAYFFGTSLGNVSISLTRLIGRSRQLLERTANITRLRQYVRRWLQWYHSGLRGLIDKRSSLEWFWWYVTKVLKLSG